MAIAEAFELLQLEQIPLDQKDSSFEVFSTSLEEENSNAESGIEDSSEEEVQGNYNVNKIKLL